jgi:hypothetical protein
MSGDILKGVAQSNLARLPYCTFSEVEHAIWCCDISAVLGGNAIFLRYILLSIAIPVNLRHPKVLLTILVSPQGELL